MAMHNATILAAENKKLRAANEKIRKKRQKKKSYVGKGGVLSVAEVQESQGRPKTNEEVEIQVVRPSNPEVSIRAPRMCSICRLLEHTARTCPER